jgi:hypothetical protein
MINRNPKKKSAMKKCTVGIHKGCIELGSDALRVAVTTQVGPRIIGCFIGKDSKFNHFVVLPPEPMPQPANGFTLYGGHRLWHSPEACPRTYEPDNMPVQVKDCDTGVEFTMEADVFTGMSKKILVEPLSNGLIMVTHTIENCGMFPVELAPWTLSMMAPGGLAVIPQGREPEGYPYTPDRHLALWAYTDLKDKRIELGSDYIFVRQDRKCKDATLKIGFNDACGWVAHINNGQALVKYFEYDPDGNYPDGGCSVECYSCNKFTEVETLGPLETLEPGECVQHIEYWQGIDNLPEIKTEEDVDKYLVPNLLSCDCDDDDNCDECDCCCDDACECCEDEHCDCGCEDEVAEEEAPKKKAKAKSKKK